MPHPFTWAVFWQEHHGPLPCQEKACLTFKVIFQQALQLLHQTGRRKEKRQSKPGTFCLIFKEKSIPHTHHWFRQNTSMRIQWIFTLFAELKKKCVLFEWVVLQGPDSAKELWGREPQGRGTKPPRDHGFSCLPIYIQMWLRTGAGWEWRVFLSNRCINKE